jgi:hypothetical protein
MIHNCQEIMPKKFRKKRDLKLYGTCIEATGKKLAAYPLITSKNSHILFNLKKCGILKTPRDLYSFRRWRT